MGQTKQTKRDILHSDANNFFASCECLSHPQYKNLPIAVAGNPAKRTGVILAKNELAKKMGVTTGQQIGQAKALCPNLVCLPPHYSLYEQISENLHNIYLDYTNFVEPLGLDECWLDVTGSEKYLEKTPLQIADEIRKRVKEEIGITVSVGVSFSKLFAKLGSDMKKPDCTTEIPYSNFKEMTYKLPLNSIIGIGKRLSKKLSSIDVVSIEDFVNLEDQFIRNLMGITGIRLKENLLGKSDENVLDYFNLPPPKSIGNGATATVDITSREDIKKMITFLCEKVSSRMIKHKVLANTLSLSIKDKNLKITHKSSKIFPTNKTLELVEDAMKISDQIWRYNFPVRAVRVRASSLVSSNCQQLSFFDKKDYSEVVSLINKKYGKIEIASNKNSFINKPPNWTK